MTIEEQFNKIANEYDENRRRFIPCFEDFYVNTTRMIFSGISAPKRVLDLGSGTGLLTYYWYKECDSAEYVAVDIAEDMLDVSRNRFEGLGNIHHRVMDYTAELPDIRFAVITLICYGVFAAMYILVYVITSHSYYRIVSTRTA